MKKILKEATTVLAVVVFISGLFWVLQARGQVKPVQAKPAPKAMTVNPKVVVKQPLIDLLPVGDPANPESYCVRNTQGKLIIRIQNRYDGKAPASTTKVEFTNNAPVFLATPSIFGRTTGRGTVSLPPIEVPISCFNPYCNFTVTADANNQTSELNEDNNRATCVCKTKGIDLVPTSAYCYNSDLVQVAVMNQGDVDAPKSKMLVQFGKVQSNGLIEYNINEELDVPAIPKGGSAGLHISKPPQYYGRGVQVKFTADYGNQILEYNEGNNIRYDGCQFFK